MMFKTACTFFLFLILVSCHKTQLEQDHSASKPEIKLQATRVVASSEAQSWDAEIYYVNFSSAEQAKVEAAVTLMKKVIASEDFKNAVINHKYKGEKTYVDNIGLTNEQIYQKILDGAEMMGNTARNNTLDVELELYQQATNTIGYTYPDTIRIWMNKKYFNRYTPVNVAGNLMHEWMHKLGFGHAMKYSKDRDYSVPYAVGYMLEKLAKRYQ